MSFCLQSSVAISPKRNQIEFSSFFNCFARFMRPALGRTMKCGQGLTLAALMSSPFLNVCRKLVLRWLSKKSSLAVLPESGCLQLGLLKADKEFPSMGIFFLNVFLAIPSWFGVSQVIPNDITFLQSILKCDNWVLLQCGKVLWLVALLEMICSLWKEQNKKCVCNNQESVSGLIALVRRWVISWALTSNVFFLASARLWTDAWVILWRMIAGIFRP